MGRHVKRVKYRDRCTTGGKQKNVARRTGKGAKIGRHRFVGAVRYMSTKNETNRECA